MWFCVRMHPKHGQLISKQLSGAQKHRIRFVGQLRVREATVRSAKTWEGGERKTVGKKKVLCTNASFHLEEERTRINGLGTHEEMKQLFFLCWADLHVMLEQDHHLFSARSTTPHCAAIAKARLSSLLFCTGTAKWMKARAATEHWLALSMSRPSNDSVQWTSESAAENVSTQTFLLSPLFKATAPKSLHYSNACF